MTPESKILNIFKSLATRAKSSLDDSRFDIFKIESQVMVMGNDQFDDYSKALEKSFLVTKIFLAITFVVYILMLLLT